MKTNFSFTTTSNYNIGDVFMSVYNKRTDNVTTTTLANITFDGVDNIDIVSVVAECLQFFKSERTYTNQIANGFKAVSEDGKYGKLPTVARSKIFSDLKNAMNNAIYVVTNVTETDVNGVYSVEYTPIIVSEIALTQTNLGMNKTAYESCKNFKHTKQWRKFANVTLLQGNIVSYISAVRSGRADEFIAPYIETLNQIEKAVDIADTIAI